MFNRMHSQNRIDNLQRMKKPSRHHHHQSSIKKTRCNSVIHITIRPWNTTFSSTNNKSLDRHNNLHMLTNNLSTGYHRNELQERSNIQSLAESSKNQTPSVNVISRKLHRSYRLSLSSVNTYKRNHQNKISPQQDDFSREIINDQQYQHQLNIFKQYETYNASSDRIGTIKDYHHNPNRKKNKKCSRLCVVTSVLVGLLLGIAFVTLLVVFLIKSKTTQGSMPTATNITLRWNKTGDTIAGVVGQTGTAPDRLNSPFGLAIDPYNTLYIADCNNHRIQRWLKGESTGTTVSGQANGTMGGTSSDLRSPADVLVDSNSNIYVADGGNSRIQFWSASATSGVTIAGNGTAGSSSGQLSNAYGIARDSSSGTLYIADYGNHRVMSYVSGASSGTMISGTGVSGTNITQLYYPTSLYFDSPSNSLVIVNFGSHNVVRWTLGASNWTLIGGSINGLFGNTSTLLGGPIGMTMDPMGNVYVADMINHRIQLFLVGQSEAVTIAGVTGVSGSNSTLLYRPYWVALDNQLNLYVADTYNHRIQRFLRY